MELKIDENNKEVIILICGSLLLGSLRNRLYLQGKSQYLGKVITAPEFSMYNMGHTCILGKGTTQIMCEAYKITQNAVLQTILKHICETEVKIQEIQDIGTCYIFWSPDYIGDKCNLIKSGDYRRKPHIRKQHKLQ